MWRILHDTFHLREKFVFLALFFFVTMDIINSVIYYLWPCRKSDRIINGNAFESKANMSRPLVYEIVSLPVATSDIFTSCNVDFI